MLNAKCVGQRFSVKRGTLGGDCPKRPARKGGIDVGFVRE